MTIFSSHSPIVLAPHPGLFGQRRPLLVVHDLDCLHRESRDGAASVFDRIARIIELARQLRLPIAHAFRPGSLVGTLPAGCRPHAKEIVYERPLLSCLSSSTFLEVVRNSGIGELVLCGFRASTAAASLLDAAALGIKAYALTDLLIDDPRDRFAVQDHHARQFIHGINAERLSVDWPLARVS